MVNAMVVYLGPIERVLESHPDVEEAYVVGALDRATGEAAHAFVVAADPDVEGLKAHVREELGADHVPATITVIDQVPMAASGKPDKQAPLGSDHSPRIARQHWGHAGLPGDRRGTGRSADGKVSGGGRKVVARSWRRARLRARSSPPSPPPDPHLDQQEVQRHRRPRAEPPHGLEQPALRRPGAAVHPLQRPLLPGRRRHGALPGRLRDRPRRSCTAPAPRPSPEPPRASPSPTTTAWCARPGG